MNLLSIGGSDPSTGAGIQSDIKVFSFLNAYPLTVITAITSQNTQKFGKVQPVAEELIKQQILSLIDDFKIDGIKIGMVYSTEIIKTIHKYLKKFSGPIVLDPVIESTTGGALIRKSAINDLRKYLISHATIITPNIFEAEILSGIKINSEKSMNDAAKKIQEMGAKTIVVTGLKQKGKIIDYVFEEDKKYKIPGKRIDLENHGSGCNFSGALLYEIASGKTIKESVKFAKQFTVDSIKKSKRLGKGISITQIKRDHIRSNLSEAIESFVKIPAISEKIPECQTNFVFSKPRPKSTKDVLGVVGRIVKTGNIVTQVGELEYGSSKHVATALIAVNQKFPKIKSAVNIKYQEKTIKKLEKLGMNVLMYDRLKEPKSIKNEGSSVNWGVKSSLLNSAKAPDVIYHLGDFGKEPMILVFGETPQSIVSKISQI